MKKTALITILASSLLLGAKPAPRPSLVETSSIEKSNVVSLQSFIGTVTFEQSSKVATQSSGAVVSIGFHKGDKINKNQVLTKLDSQILDAQIIAAKSRLDETLVNLEKAKKDLNRYTKLISQDAVSQSTYDDNFFKVKSLETKVVSLKADIKAQEIQKAKKVTVAPFNGVIISKNLDIGDWATNGSVIGELVNINSVQVEVNLPQSILSRIKIKMPVDVKINAKKYNGYVKYIIPKGDISSRTFPVNIALNSKSTQLLEGMSAEVEIQSGKDVKALLVPRDSVIKRFGQNVIFVNAKGSAAMIPVSIIGYSHKKVAVSGNGLNENMRVVTKGNERIFPHSPLQDITKAK